MRLFDAHCHLQDARLEPFLAEALRVARAQGVACWIVNATKESDWEQVAHLSKSFPGIRASFGLHPWWQKERSPDWIRHLESLLRLHPTAGIGETGLDRWMPHPNLADQTAVLEVHLRLAREWERPLSLHCLKAWPELQKLLLPHLPLPRGVLLHSFAAPPEHTAFWVQTGAYFSFSPAFLHPRKASLRARFANLPLDRILIETDAPDMAPPQELSLHFLPNPTPSRACLNHPANLPLCLRALAQDRHLPEDTLAEILFQNALRLFGSC